MREIILGTAGHVDHGKTSLVKALTGIDTDRLKEEKERGITIELGFAHLDLPCGVRLGIVDVPGHERFVKNMVAGAGGMDLVALVIAADEGVMPQTREHIAICSLLGLTRGLVVITKKDLVEPDWLDLVIEETRDFLSSGFLAGAPIVPVSSTTGEGLAEVVKVLDSLAATADMALAHGPFRMPVDRVFTMKGFGTVVTGTTISGRIGVGDPVNIYPQDLAAKIRGLQVHGEDVNQAEAGARTAVNIQGVERDVIPRGSVLATPGCLRPSFLLDADFHYLSANSKNFRNRTRVRVHLGTDEVLGRLVLLEDEEILPGQQANVQVLLEAPVAVWPGDRYVVRSYSPVTTIGGGMVLNASPMKRRRFRPANGPVFTTYHHGSKEDLALLHLVESGIIGLTTEELAVKMAIFGKSLKKILDVPISTQKILVVPGDRQRLLAEGVYEGLKKKTLELLTIYHQENPLQPGLSKEELRTRLARRLDPRLFQHLLNDLVKAARIALDDAWVRLDEHRVSFKADEESLREDLSTFYLQAGLTPPTVKETQEKFSLVAPGQVLSMLAVLVRDKLLVKVKEDLYFHCQPLALLEQQLLAHLNKEGEIDPGGFKTLTSLTRKFSIPLLEYFDRLKLTIRVGDKRLLRERKGGDASSPR